MYTVNIEYKGAKFKLHAMRSPARCVLFSVPVTLKADGTPSTMIQYLGRIKRKNDKRFVAFRSPNKMFFETFPVEPVYEKVHATLEEAQQWILDGIPSEVDRSNVTLLSIEDIEAFQSARGLQRI